MAGVSCAWELKPTSDEFSRVFSGKTQTHNAPEDCEYRGFLFRQATSAARRPMSGEVAPKEAE
jgi:hypothetical protein